MIGDEHLIEAVAAGDGRALKELFRRHVPWVAARLRRAMPAHGVEDAPQETFIAVWRGAEGYRAERAWRGGVEGSRNRDALSAYRIPDDPEVLMDENGPDTRGGATALHKLVERVMTPPQLNGGSGSEPPRLYPGRLPDGLPENLPIPDGATIVGGTAQNLGRGLRMTEVLLDVSIPAEEFREEYRRQLLAAGWREDEEWSPGPSGFVPPGLPGLFVRAAQRSPGLRRRLRGRVPGLPSLFPDFLRLEENGPRLDVTAADHENAPTDVRLRVVTGRRSRHPRHNPIWDTIPTLVPPPGARGRRDDSDAGILHPPRGARGLSGGSGGRWEPDGAYSHATLQTDLALTPLASHYSAQLKGAGWHLVEQGGSGPQAWSTWRFTDGEGSPWAGTFSALRLASSSTRYLLQVHTGRLTDA